MTATETHVRTGPRHGVGESAPRPDGGPKVRGEFAFAGDLWADGMLWGRTLRSPHASARIRSIETTAALALPGVHAVITAVDLPGATHYGLEHRDQPVLANDIVRHVGEPVAAVAAVDPETARRACAAIAVDYEVTPPLVDASLSADAVAIHPDGNVFRHLRIHRGEPDAHGPVVVEGTYEIGMQDQAFLGPEAGLALPAADGGVDLIVSTQWLHNDRDQVAECLGLEPELVRLSLGGVGGAFGAREDLSLHIHACVLAMRTGRPVKVVYSREESFLGHVHRHPGRIWMRHSAEADGTLRTFEARILLDGGAYRSSSCNVISNASCFAAGPYRVDDVHVDGLAVRTNNPPCGAMRGFGAVQVCFAHEAQMDLLAERCGVDPVRLRLRNALQPGDKLLTGQVITGAFPAADVIRACAALPAPPQANTDGDGAAMSRPGGSGRTADSSDVRRASGFAVGFKNLLYSEGHMDGSEAEVSLRDGLATVTCAAAEVGQGFVTLAQQITRTVLGVDDVLVAPADTAIGSAGSTSASRQSWMSGGAIERASRSVLAQLLEHVAATHGVAATTLALDGTRIVSTDGSISVAVAEAAPGETFTAHEIHHHRPTQPLDRERPRRCPCLARVCRASRDRRRRSRAGAARVSCRSPRRRTSARLSTRCRWWARSRAASPRASASP